MPADFEVQEVDDLATLESGLDALESSGEQEKRFTLKRVVLKSSPVFIAIAVVLGIWQLLFALKVKPDYVIPSPQMVWDSFTAQWKLGMVWPAVQNSITRGFIGFALSIAIATPIGILVSQVKFARLALRPHHIGLQRFQEREVFLHGHRQFGRAQGVEEVDQHGWALAVAALHEHQFLKQRHILLVFQQRTHQRRHSHFVVLGLKRGQRNILGHQEFEPVQEL